MRKIICWCKYNVKIRPKFLVYIEGKGREAHKLLPPLCLSIYISLS